MTVVSAFNNLGTCKSPDCDHDEPCDEPLAQRLYDSAVGRMLWELMPPLGVTLLDAGCGTGGHSVRVAMAGWRTFGVDVSHVALLKARRRALDAGVAGRTTFEHADLLHLPFADASFDAVFSWDVIAHIPDASRALAELVRVTAPGGRIALQVTNRRPWEGAVGTAARLWLNRRSHGSERRHFGTGNWRRTPVGRLYHWRLDVGNVIREMEDRGCRCVHRSAVELAAPRPRLPGVLRRAVLRLNNASHALNLSAGLASTNLLVFEKLPLAAGAESKPRIVYHLPAWRPATPLSGPAAAAPCGPRMPHTPHRPAGAVRRMPERWSKRSPIVDAPSFRES